MSINLSRRRWIISAAVVAVSTPSVVADPPSSEVSLRLTPARPVMSRSKKMGEYGVRRIITAIAVDPRGQYVAAAGDDYAIRIVDTSDLTVVRTLVKAHRDVVRTLTFSPDGKHLASAGNDGRITLWDREESFKVVKQFQKVPAIARLCFSPDGSELAAVGFDDTVHWIGNDNPQQPRLQCGCNDLRAIAFRDDGEVLAVAGRDGVLHLFDPRNGARSDYRLDSARIRDVKFHRSSKTAICAAEDGHVIVFDTGNQRLVSRFRVTTGKLFAVAILSDQLVAVAGSDNVIRIVNTYEGRTVRELEGHSGSVSSLGASGGMLFSGSYDTTIRRWAIDDFVPRQPQIAERTER